LTPNSSASLIFQPPPLYCFLTFALFIISQTSAMSTTATYLNECNYRQWAIEAKAVLRAQGLSKCISGELGVPRPPIVATCDAYSDTSPAACDTRNLDYDFFQESTDTSYLTQFYHFLRVWERWQMSNDTACGNLPFMMESSFQIWYQDLTEPKQLRDAITANFGKIIQLNGQLKMVKLTSCQLKSCPSLTESISV